MKSILLAGIICSLLTVICGKIVIPILRKIKAGQTVLKYVETHKDKNGTPTMGGLFFIVPSVIVCFVFGGYRGRLSLVATSIGLAFLLVGFLDDFIKIKFKKNEGLKAFQKIIFQTGIALLAGFFVYFNNITQFYIPFVGKVVDFKAWSIPIVSIIFIALTNGVNLTDGLDGLASSVSGVYLIFMIALISLQQSFNSAVYLVEEEYYYLKLLSSCVVGGICGFLVFNTSKAKVFMGDTGSLSLGGFIGAISVFSSNSLFIPIIGIMFVLSCISVILQVVFFKKTGRRVFLMAPLHHHFQMKGHTEAKIVYVYALITAIFGILSIIQYL